MDSQVVATPPSGANGSAREGPLTHSLASVLEGIEVASPLVARRSPDEPVIFRAWQVDRLFRLVNRVEISAVLKVTPEQSAPTFVKDGHARLCDLLNARGVEYVYSAMNALFARAENAERMPRAKADEWWGGFVLPLANGCQVVASAELRRNISVLVRALNYKEGAYGPADEVEAEIQKYEEGRRIAEQRRLEDVGSFLDDIIIGEEPKEPVEVKKDEAPQVPAIATVVVDQPVERTPEQARSDNNSGFKLGEMYDGTVAHAMDYGVFVMVGGARGLVHVSNISGNPRPGRETLEDLEKAYPGGSVCRVKYLGNFGKGPSFQFAEDVKKVDVVRYVGDGESFVCMVHPKGVWWLRGRQTCQLNREIGELLLAVVPEDHTARKDAEELAKVAREGWTFCSWDGQDILLVDLQRILGADGIKESEEYRRLRQICPEEGRHRVFGPMNRPSEVAEQARQEAEEEKERNRLFAQAVRDPSPREGDSPKLAAFKRQVRARAGGGFVKAVDDESAEVIRPSVEKVIPPKEPIPCSCGRGNQKAKYGKCGWCLKEAHARKKSAAAPAPKKEKKSGRKEKGRGAKKK